MSDTQPTERLDLNASDQPAARPVARPTGKPAQHDSLRVARQWFNQSDNILMAVTAVVAVVFLVLVSVL